MTTYPIPNGTDVDWLDAAPLNEAERRDYFIRLITILSHRVSSETMQDAVPEALPRATLGRYLTLTRGKIGA